ncbi:MAG: class I SAM-dependent methyltransferase [Candidatus Nitricoxidivorans perseverans]|uniref:site-specific DNA-methyltransferase (adenine-specific) n=1 Tax=Candidatus Nitricoxidivorans perseverans TaxID=2975601 RepID=A0AA49IXS1_9PROT|nr:MAG: class I SAM-dependent methyltransferase [Candidatus Nitricoxidivorans perseverans]
MNKPRDVAGLGQIFTPPAVVERMLARVRNRGRVLEPACGDGAFSARIPPHYPEVVAIELDPAHCPIGALNMDFFTYPASEKFDTVIGNPPYVKARDIPPGTRRHLSSRLLDGHANLYLHFIEKCVRHLAPGGELVFITPRDFLKATAATRLNTWLFDQGTITDFEDLGDARVFDGVTPNCAIWRYELGNMARRLDDGRRMSLAGGQILFTRGIYSVPLNSVFSVKVGAVSGADDIFADAERGNADFVCSKTAQTGERRRMIFPDPTRPPPAFLEPFKERLLARRVAKFDERNWWQWGRRHHVSDAPRIYVNHKTRNPRPFFIDDCPNYDGSVLALFPHRPDRLKPADLRRLTSMLNDVNWHELGFVCDGRFLFSQRSLENTLLPEDFAAFEVGGLV